MGLRGVKGTVEGVRAGANANDYDAVALMRRAHLFPILRLPLYKDPLGF